MICKSCEIPIRKNVFKCPGCQSDLKGGLVFVTGIPGSGTKDFLEQVASLANAHDHQAEIFDVGERMKKFALDDDPDVSWDNILDSDELNIRHLRNLACQELRHKIELHPDVLRIVDLHMSFRWKAYLTKGFEPHLIGQFSKDIKLFVNLNADLLNVQRNLQTTPWGNKDLTELIIWRDEELFLTDLFASICGRLSSLTMSIYEPPKMLENIIWHPDKKRVYLSFPITNILEDEVAKSEIETFREALREFVVVFDPYASKDYDAIYNSEDLQELEPKIGEITEARDYRFIDQSEAIVVYFPKKVDSKGVDAEMKHAVRTGKKIFLYCPEDLGGGPFAVRPGHYSNNSTEYLEILREELGN